MKFERIWTLNYKANITDSSLQIEFDYNFADGSRGLLFLLHFICVFFSFPNSLSPTFSKLFHMLCCSPERKRYPHCKWYTVKVNGSSNYCKTF